MANDLIQKNAELGRFLFCERYTLQPVKNALYIAEGQDLKRGAVVDVNGVLVGTNSLMPYAVLENDCDTRAKGAFASVFVKGEFNFDKLFFADGLSKEDIDNIVYNGSGLGIVIKPYDYDTDFSPVMVPTRTSEENPIINAVEIEELIFANKEIGEATIRFSFSNPDYSPLTSPNPYDRGYHEGTWTKLRTSYANIWEYHTEGDTWHSEFSRLQGGESSTQSQACAFCYPNENWNLTKVLRINFDGITDAFELFANCLDIIELPKELDNTSGVTKFPNAFRNLYRCTKFPRKIDLTGLITGSGSSYGIYNMFYCCYAMKIQPELILPEQDVEVGWAFSLCTSLTSLKANLSYCKDISGFGSGCTSVKEIDITTTSETTKGQYAFSRTFNLKSVNPMIVSAITDARNFFSAASGSSTYDMVFYDGSVRYLKKNIPSSDNGKGFTIVPDVKFTAATNCSALYRGRKALETIPDLSVYTPVITNSKQMFSNCINVKYGILEAYNFLVSRGASLTDHTDTFFNCGINTAEGLAARALIPKSWGGDAEG